MHTNTHTQNAQRHQNDDDDVGSGRQTNPAQHTHIMRSPYTTRVVLLGAQSPQARSHILKMTPKTRKRAQTHSAASARSTAAHTPRAPNDARCKRNTIRQTRARTHTHTRVCRRSHRRVRTIRTRALSECPAKLTYTHKLCSGQFRYECMDAHCGIAAYARAHRTTHTRIRSRIRVCANAILISGQDLTEVRARAHAYRSEQREQRHNDADSPKTASASAHNMRV